MGEFVRFMTRMDRRVLGTARRPRWPRWWSIRTAGSSCARAAATSPLPACDKNRRSDQAAVVENKFFGPLLAIIREDQQRRDANTKPRRSIRPSREIRAN